MKKAIFILVLLVAVISVYGQSLKGFTLGEQLTGECKTTTTVAGIEGMVMADTLKDGRIYGIAFTPSQDGSTPSGILKYELENLIKGVESNYNVKLKPFPKKYKGEPDGYSALSDGVGYLISILNKDKPDVPMVILAISDKALASIKEQETRSDF